MRNVAQGRASRADLAKIREVYNEAWEKNWGFVPMTPEEMDFMAKRLKPLLVPGAPLAGGSEEAGRRRSSRSPSC